MCIHCNGTYCKWLRTLTPYGEYPVQEISRSCDGFNTGCVYYWTGQVNDSD